MEIWIAVGDETGKWDIVDGSFGTGFTGLAWVLGPLSVWERALQMPIGGISASTVFSQSFANRLPIDSRPLENSAKYHLLDVWGYCKAKGLNIDVSVDIPQEEPILELLRVDADWLLRQSGLGVLAVGGSAADGKAAGLGLSGDGLRERARAFAGLMTIAIPFLPGDATINLLAEGRTELAIANAVTANRFSQRVSGNRYLEPYRDFIGRLTEDLGRASQRCLPVVADGTVVSKFHCKGGKGLAELFGKIRSIPDMKSHAREAVAAMNGIADLAASLIPRPEIGGCRLLVPQGFSSNHWAGNFRDLRYAIAG